jgi:hypothetical protein|eukprot:COSAG01_NODE_388_length_17730_cov_13.231978_21_plen_48_part_00
MVGGHRHIALHYRGLGFILELDEHAADQPNSHPEGNACRTGRVSYTR